MKKIISLILSVVIFIGFTIPIFAEQGTNYEAEADNGFYADANIDLECDLTGAYLCEATTGKVLYAKDEYKAASPASVTKVMTLLLVCEALKEGKFNLEDNVRVSAKAASMGGSQVFLEEGERITVEELIKAAIIASGNDASVALAELTAGSEGAFVNMMNKRAKELGLKNTNFENTTGLDDTTTKHYSCAADIAKMSRELISHDIILKYSSIWQDTIRDGEFTLTNTNRLVRYYDGCNGLKTGSTDKAGFCVSATAKRGNMQLIAVIMGAPTREDRNNAARILLDYGFANFALYERDEEFIEDCMVLGGVKDQVALYRAPFSVVINKSYLSSVEEIYELPENLSAPIDKEKPLGRVTYMLNGKQIGYSEIYAKETVEKIDFVKILSRILKRIICG